MPTSQTIEKGQGVTLGSSPGNYAEDKILDTLRRVKAIDPNISTIFYYNSILGVCASPVAKLRHAANSPCLILLLLAGTQTGRSTSCTRSSLSTPNGGSSGVLRTLKERVLSAA